MLSRRAFTFGLLTPAALLVPRDLRAQEGVYVTEEAAPAAVFPSATAFERQVVLSTPELRGQVQALLGSPPSLWESHYVIFQAKRGTTLLGYGVIVEEIGKHQPITFIVGVRPAGTVADVAVMVYREPYGGEVRYARFLAQYANKTLRDALLPYRDIRNITGATLSCTSIGQGVRKALALVQVLFLTETQPK